MGEGINTGSTRRFDSVIRLKLYIFCFILKLVGYFLAGVRNSGTGLGEKPLEGKFYLESSYLLDVDNLLI